MSKHHRKQDDPSEVDEPIVVGTNLTIEFVLGNLGVGRTAQQLIKKYPELSAEAIEAAQQLTLHAVSRYDDKSAFRASLRIQHLIGALQPHPVVATITDAFKEVRLGRGPSLRQMYIMDGYGEDETGRLISHQEFLQRRSQDETNQWQGLTLADLDKYPSLAHADDESFRFYIPAHMIYCLTQPFAPWDVYYYLEPSDYHVEWYSLLDDKQRHAIATFLWHALDAPPTNYDTPTKEIEAALEKFWQQYL